MCDPVSIITTAVSAAVSLSQNRRQRDPEPPPPPAPPPQRSQQPDQQAVRGARSQGGGAMAGPAGTMLTGGSGVAPGGLNLGRNELLGS